MSRNGNAARQEKSEEYTKERKRERKKERGRKCVSVCMRTLDIEKSRERENRVRAREKRRCRENRKSSQSVR